MRYVRKIAALIVLPHELCHYGAALLLGMDAELHVDFVRIRGKELLAKQLIVGLAPFILGLIVTIIIARLFHPAWWLWFVSPVWFMLCESDLIKVYELLVAAAKKHYQQT